jgi:hypothetical protein
LLARCLELVHDYSTRTTSILRSKQDHKAIVDAVVAALPAEIHAPHAEWINAALSAANQKRLVDQMRDIADSLPEKVLRICEVVDTDEFSRDIRSARNHYTHPTRKVPKGVPVGRDLYILIQRMWFVLRAFVFIELGLDNGEVQHALSRSAKRHYLLG